VQTHKRNCYPLASAGVNSPSDASVQIHPPESETKAILISADVWVIKNCLKKKTHTHTHTHTKTASSNAEAHKCKFDCDVLAPTVIAVLNRLFPVSAERHHSACQKGPRVINAHEKGCI